MQQESLVGMGQKGKCAKSILSAFDPLNAARGLTNVEYRLLDAERLDLPHDSVDGVMCRFGYMLMADPAAALRETRRVLRDGGTLSFTVWMGPERNPWAALPPLTLVERGHLPPPEPGTPGIFALADHEAMIGRDRRSDAKCELFPRARP